MPLITENDLAAMGCSDRFAVVLDESERLLPIYCGLVTVLQGMRRDDEYTPQHAFAALLRIVETLEDTLLPLSEHYESPTMVGGTAAADCHRDDTKQDDA